MDGYVAYKFAGWDTKPYTMEVIDLVAATESGYLELWQFLGSIDMIERVTWAEAPVDDPLTWALEDPRCIESGENADMLWLRMLDTVKALGARRYSSDGSLVLRVTDTLGLAAGTFTLCRERRRGEPLRLLRTAPNADLSLDVADLGSIYLGAVCPVTLAAAGRITRARTRGGADSAADVRRRTCTALPDALLGGSPAVPACALTRVHRKRLD